MDREIILRHIQGAKENACVDFKREFYASLKHSDIAKDVAAFANLVNKEDKYIIFGVDDETREIVGMDSDTFAKQDDIDSYLEDKIEPFPMVNSGLIKTDDGKVIGYIMVSSKNSNPPYVIKETCGKGHRIEKGDIFIRKGSCNKKASRADIDEMYMKNGEMKIRIHDEITVVEPIHSKDDIGEPATYGHIDIEIFNDSTRPLLICGGKITIQSRKCLVERSVWSSIPIKNIYDRPIEIPAHTRKIYTLLYDFYSQDCVDMEFDVNGHIDGLVDVRVRLVDTDSNIYESDESKLLMKVKGDILHKVRLKASYKKKKPLLLRNGISLWFKR
ncbi:MAG: ATP-binding protein [Tyzzerella sp.]|nr:ATP-binding protein [Tyzzerella sp.]